MPNMSAPFATVCKRNIDVKNAVQNAAQNAVQNAVQNAAHDAPWMLRMTLCRGGELAQLVRVWGI